MMKKVDFRPLGKLLFSFFILCFLINRVIEKVRFIEEQLQKVITHYFLTFKF